MTDHDRDDDTTDVPLDEIRRRVCAYYRSKIVPPTPDSRVGISRKYLANPALVPIHGMRIPPRPGTNGWFIWAGEEMSEDPEYFVPVHTEHLVERHMNLLPFLALDVGYRFVLAPGYQDIWFDAELVARYARPS